MAMDTFVRLLPSFSSADLVYLQGWGEPLLHPEFWEMTHQARAGGARLGFTTGGVLLDRKNRRALLESGVEIVCVSLAGATPRTHDHFRRGNPLEVLDRNLRILKQEKRATGSPYPALHIAFLLMRENLPELPRVVELAERWGASQVVVSHLSLILNLEMEEQSLLARPPQGSRASDLLEDVQRQAQARGITFHVYGLEGQKTQAACRENVLRSCFVSAQGKVSPCVMCNLGLKEGARVTHRFLDDTVPVHTLTFGNVRDRPLEEIWQSEPARMFRKIFRERIWQGNQGSQGLPEPCRHCYKLLES